MFRRVSIFLIVLLSASKLLSQEATYRAIQVDTFTIVGQSLTLSKPFPVLSSISFQVKKNNDWQSQEYSFHLQENTIIFDDKPQADQLLVRYRYFDVIPKDTIGIEILEKDPYREQYIGFVNPSDDQNQGLFPDQLDYDGTFGRGLSVGNNQSLALNSNLNLQLNGKIGDGIDLRAVINDANIPIQAEGNTQQLQEFDQVYIELIRKEQKLTAGDYRLERPNSYFINYVKKLKGLQYQVKDYKTDYGSISAYGSVAIAGGKFNRQLIAPVEGNQGPYKLQGADNEQFIIVQSGTEKVYIDGQLLTRGENFDYVISYDRAEVSFTEKQIISKDSRIIVEFEYQSQNYARSIITAGTSNEIKGHKVAFNLYREQDNKNAPGTLQLTDEDRSIMTSAGVNDTSIQVNTVNPYDSDSNTVPYRKEFSEEFQDTILVYDGEIGPNSFEALFSDVGKGNGSYEISQDVNINSRVYKYVGEGNGRYLPIKVLIPAISKMMMDVSHQWDYSENGGFRSALSMSQFDRNLFSKLDNEDNNGLALRLDWNHKLNWKNNVDNSTTISAFSEFTSLNFRPLNPYRNQEFSRDWNLINQSRLVREIWGGFVINTQLSNKHQLLYSINTLQQTDLYSGYRHNWIVKNSWSGLTYRFRGSYLTTMSDTLSSRYFRPNFTINQNLPWMNSKVGATYDAEYNGISNTTTNKLTDRSFEFDRIDIFLQSKDTTNWSYKINYAKRYDRIPFEGEYKRQADANIYSANFMYQGQNNSITLNGGFRELIINENIEDDLKSNNSLLAGLDYRFSWWDKIIRGNTHLDLAAGQEPRLEFDYRQVPKGEGQYIWIDDGDGIQQKNEFQIAPFSDQGEYIRVNLFNNEFIQVFKQEASQILRYDPSKWMLSENKLLKTFAKFSTIQSFKIIRKDQLGERIPTLWQFTNIEQDTQLVTYTSSISSNYYWNRGSQSYDLQFSYIRLNNLSALTTGSEINSSEQFVLSGRKNIQRKLELEVDLTQKVQTFKAISFPQNNFEIESQVGKLESTYLFSQNLNSTVSYSYIQKKNLLGIERSSSHQGKFGISYSRQNQLRFDADFQMNYIQYESGDNQNINFVMLEGLQNGRNFLWELSATKRIFENFDLIVGYNGRKSGISRVIHTGNAQIRATF